MAQPKRIYNMRYSDRVLNRIKKFIAKDFQVYACNAADGTPRVSLVAEFEYCDPFMLPMTVEAAHEMGLQLLAATMELKPEIMFPAHLAKKYRAGDISLEQLKAAV
ncbi:hypothetical protein GCM10010533_33100 [Mycolicibacterium pallens]